jgi:hypothetical protein
MKLSEWEREQYKLYNDLLNAFRTANNLYGVEEKFKLCRESLLRKCNHMVSLGLMAVTSKKEGRYKNPINYYISIVDVYPLDIYFQERAKAKEKITNHWKNNKPIKEIKKHMLEEIVVYDLPELCKVYGLIPKQNVRGVRYSSESLATKYREQTQEFRRDNKSPKTFVSGSSLSYV